MVEVVVFVEMHSRASSAETVIMVAGESPVGDKEVHSLWSGIYAAKENGGSLFGLVSGGKGAGTATSTPQEAGWMEPATGMCDLRERV